MNVTDARLEEDQKVYEKMEELEKQGKKDTEEYKKLYEEYYVTNKDIRAYWIPYYQ